MHSLKPTVSYKPGSNTGGHAIPITYLARLAIVALLTGCASGPAKAIRDRMVAHCEDYRRVQVLPVWFAGSWVEGSDLTTNDLIELNREVGTNLLMALCAVLTEKRYEVVQTNPVLFEPEDSGAFDECTSQLLAQVRTNFLALYHEIQADGPSRTGKPMEYTADGSVLTLRQRLKQCEADLLVLVDSQASLESPEEHHKRHKWNWTGGVALMPLFVAFSSVGGGMPDLPLRSCPGSMRHRVLVVDARTREVLFCNSRTFPGEDASNPNALKDKLRDTLADLADLPKSRSRPTLYPVENGKP
jgi:hypothetical protein